MYIAKSTSIEREEKYFYYGSARSYKKVAVAELFEQELELDLSLYSY
jgi:hypothetical protein